MKQGWQQGSKRPTDELAINVVPTLHFLTALMTTTMMMMMLLMLMLLLMLMMMFRGGDNRWSCYKCSSYPPSFSSPAFPQCSTILMMMIYDDYDDDGDTWWFPWRLYQLSNISCSFSQIKFQSFQFWKACLSSSCFTTLIFCVGGTPSNGDSL